MNNNRVLTIPNIISFSRIILSLFIVYFVYVEEWFLALFISLVSGLSDVLDGFIARRLKMGSRIGMVLDPTADKISMLSIYFILVIKGVILKQVGLIFIFKDVSIILLFALAKATKRNTNVNPTIIGKITIVFQFFTVCAALLSMNYPIPQNVLFYPSLLLCTASVISYIKVLMW